MEKAKAVEKTYFENMPMKKIVEPNFIARVEFDKIKMEELKQSIKEKGLINPITVKDIGMKYEIVAGHRRYLACRELRLENIKVIVVKGTKLELELIKLDENLKRDDLSDIEEAYYIERLKKLGVTQNKDMAKKMGKSESYVFQKLAILNYPDYLFEALRNKQINFSVARELIRIKDEIVLKDYVFHAQESGLSPTLAKKWADDWAQLKKIRDEITPGDNPILTSGHDQRIKVQCWQCDDHYFVEETVMIRVCKEDLQIFQQAKQISKYPANAVK